MPLTETEAEVDPDPSVAFIVKVELVAISGVTTTPLADPDISVCPAVVMAGYVLGIMFMSFVGFVEEDLLVMV